MQSFINSGLLERLRRFQKENPGRNFVMVVETTFQRRKLTSESPAVTIAGSASTRNRGEKIMPDPTYNKVEIFAKPIWKAAWLMSEHLNDSAPLGWSRYIPVAETLQREGLINE